MKITYEIQPGCTIEQETQGVKQTFQMFAHLQEVFGVKKCGHCGSAHIKPRFRTARRKDNNAECEYYDYKCQDCGHEYKFGQKQQPGSPLFPKGWEPGYQGDNGGSPPNGRDQQPMPVYQYGAGEEYTPAPPLQQQQQPVAAASGSELPW